MEELRSLTACRQKLFCNIVVMQQKKTVAFLFPPMRHPGKHEVDVVCIFLKELYTLI